jgi:hypothetical protein
LHSAGSVRLTGGAVAVPGGAGLGPGCCLLTMAQLAGCFTPGCAVRGLLFCSTSGTIRLWAKGPFAFRWERPSHRRCGCSAWRRRAWARLLLIDHSPAGRVLRTGRHRARSIVLLYIWDHPLVGEWAGATGVQVTPGDRPDSCDFGIRGLADGPRKRIRGLSVLATESPLNFILSAASTLFRGAEFHVVDFRADRFPETVGTVFSESEKQAGTGFGRRGDGGAEGTKRERDTGQWPRPYPSIIAN